MNLRGRGIPFVFLFFGISSVALPQWAQQTIRLVPGWNAVFFEVQPQPRDCDRVFAGIPVESVWAWNRRFISVQFLQDPDTLLPDQPEWLHFFPTGSPNAFLTNLFIIQGGRPYLIKLGGTQTVNLTVTGRPKLRPIEWIADSFNFIGFHVESASPPTFANFFAPSSAHAGQDIFRITASGQWQKVTNPATERIARGAAYWVYCQGESDYQGPLSVDANMSDGVEFARILVQHTILIRNASASERTVTMRQTASRQPPEQTLPALAGPVVLSYLKMDLPNGIYERLPFPDPLTLTIPAGSEISLRLAVRRTDFAPFTPPAGRDALYQSLLEVWDGAGSYIVLPVSAQGLNAPRSLAASASAARAELTGGARLNDAPPHPRVGLWVGDAVIKAVSNPTSGSLDMNRPLPVAQPLTFRLIIHVDSYGQARLLQQVLQMWREGAWIPNPEDPTSSTYILDPTRPGRTVLLTDDSLIPEYSGQALRDVKLVGRRLSTAAFGFRQPIEMGGGEFGVAGGPPTVCTVALDYRDPLNPFKHKYHPDHDNLDMRFEQELPDGHESYTTTRTLFLQFTAADPEDFPSAGWGDDVLGGIYREVIEGIHRSPIHVEGTFRLHQISGVPVLNDGRR